MQPSTRDVAAIRLLGAPRRVLLDEAALGAAGTPARAQLEAMLARLGVPAVVVEAGAADVGPKRGLAVGIFGGPHHHHSRCHAWYVGAGAAPGWMVATDGRGQATTAMIVALLGTGFAQERAGAAFRAAGRGEGCPLSARYPARGIFAGITAAVAPSTPAPAPPAGRPPRDTVRPRGEPAAAGGPLTEDSWYHALALSLGALERCVAPSGAIAAAPPAVRPEDPDYWFCWQRDAAHVGVALHALSVTGPRALRARAAKPLRGYLEFLARTTASLPHDADIAAGRWTVTGGQVTGYGDPQPDGPAATAVMVLSVVDEPRRALSLARPFLHYLCGAQAARPGYDLWELSLGRSFHAVNLARRALRHAEQLARATGDALAEDYATAAAAREADLAAFWDPATARLRHCLAPDPPWFAATSRLDMSVLGSMLLAYDVRDPCANVDNVRIEATQRLLVEQTVRTWPVNRQWWAGGHRGGGVGRFPEDCNDGRGSTGGSPWPVTTLWMAQYHLRRVERARHQGMPRSAASGAEFRSAQGYLDFVRAHVDLAAVGEQISATNGATQGSRPLAWSHAELITTVLLARAGAFAVDVPGPSRRVVSP